MLQFEQTLNFPSLSQQTLQNERSWISYLTRGREKQAGGWSIRERERRSCTCRASRGEIKIFRRKRARTQRRRNWGGRQDEGRRIQLIRGNRDHVFGLHKSHYRDSFRPAALRYCCASSRSSFFSGRFSPLLARSRWGEASLLSPRVKRARRVSTGNRSEIRLPPAFREKLSRVILPCPSGTCLRAEFVGGSAQRRLVSRLVITNRPNLLYSFADAGRNTRARSPPQKPLLPL